MLLTPYSPHRKKQPAPERAELGQIFTPPKIASFIASIFPDNSLRAPFSLLDAGAGKGALTLAFLERMRERVSVQGKITLFEKDENIMANLRENLYPALSRSLYDIAIHNTDFVCEASAMVMREERPFTHAILNPPYRKIASSSLPRRCLHDAGIETVNLYSGFTALSLSLLQPSGHLVAIIPRSFCNGPYYRSFRKFILAHSAIRQIHLFKSRTGTFDNVLQENVIIHLERDAPQDKIRISLSTDASLADYSEKEYPFSTIIDVSSSECFFSIPEQGNIAYPSGAEHRLQDLSLSVSTGPIVEFRMLNYLKRHPDNNDAPLLYPGHFNPDFSWPRMGFKKYNAIRICPETLKYFYPAGWYVIVRRLSSREEKRRIIANVVNPASFPGRSLLGFENHLNVYHEKHHGLQKDIACGLAAYLNSGRIDAIFRSFNGHTQVNATDLRSLLYPSWQMLHKIGSISESLSQCTSVEKAWLKNILP